MPLTNVLSIRRSTILALAKELFGKQFKQRVLELNASDERGISVVRDKVKTFAQNAVSTAEGGPSFKLIILDEADAMSGDAQSALRRIMERYTRVTRFCLICNYVSRIIEPLASRCAKFRFRPLPREPMLARLGAICDAEQVETDSQALDYLLQASGGDMRRAVTLLQCASNFNARNVDSESIVEVAGILPNEALEPTWSAIKQGGFDGVMTAVQQVLAAGYSSTMMTTKLLERILSDETASDETKALLLLKLAETDKKLVDGADEEMQLLDLCCEFAATLKAAD